MNQQELLDLIETVTRKGREELDLRDRGLTELYPEIGQLTQLQSLNLRSYQLKAFPSINGVLQE